MKILFIAPYIPNRIRVRPYQWIKTLSQMGHDVTLVAIRTTQEEEADTAELRALGVRVLAHRLPPWRSLVNTVAAVPSQVPLQAVYCDLPQLQATLAHLLRQEAFDVIHVEHLRGARYGLHARTILTQLGTSSGADERHLPIIWDSVDSISHLFEQTAAKSRNLKSRLMARLELNRTRRYEGWLVHQFDQVLVTSSADKMALERLAVAVPAYQRTCAGLRHLNETVTILPNGVDLEYFTPNGLVTDPRRIVFTGKMSYHANVTAAVHLVQDIMPLVWAQRPDIDLWIVGKDPTPQVRGLAAAHADTAPQGTQPGRVIVTGTVPDVRPYLHQSAVAVAPIEYGAGIQNKVLEAMASGAPIIASSAAVSALAARPGHDLLVADEKQAFANALLALLDNPEQRARLAHAGRTYVETYHSWRVAGHGLEDIYRSAIEADSLTAAPIPNH